MTDKKAKRKKTESLLPLDLSGFHVDIDAIKSGMAVCITGASGVSSFSSECVEVRTASGSVLFVGSALSLVLYGKARLEIRGRISEVKLFYDKH